MLLPTYLTVIKTSVGTRLFQHLYVKVKGKKTDITNGVYSCAFYVSSILAIFNLIATTHATVEGTKGDMIRRGWKSVNKPKIGSVLIWEPVKSKNGKFHKHIGFYIGNKKAISNSSRKRSPVIHHWTFGKKNGKLGRKIELILWHNNLGLPR